MVAAAVESTVFRDLSGDRPERFDLARILEATVASERPTRHRGGGEQRITLGVGPWDAVVAFERQPFQFDVTAGPRTGPAHQVGVETRATLAGEIDRDAFVGAVLGVEAGDGVGQERAIAGGG